jgi:hypothetical protein
MRDELRETQERLDFAERMLTHQRRGGATPAWRRAARR